MQIGDISLQKHGFLGNGIYVFNDRRCNCEPNGFRDWSYVILCCMEEGEEHADEGSGGETKAADERNCNLECESSCAVVKRKRGQC